MPARSTALWTEAMGIRTDADLLTSESAFTAPPTLAAHEAAQRQTARAFARLNAAQSAASGLLFHANVAATAVDMFLQHRACPRAILALNEAIEIAPQTLRNT